MYFDYEAWRQLMFISGRTGNAKGYGLYVNSHKARVRGGWKKKKNGRR